ncbi:endonuclease domain-containing protein [Lysinibacillus sp. NPDC097162]|uniref:endonuclease domain-containing protein n=1 Tax=Lysinibacillus sp. NPDC097162 TaxID=3364140 RepID=UPI00380E574E
MKITGTTLIGLFCKGCGQHTQKNVKYLRRRLRGGKTDFYCSRRCADSAHSLNMKGEGNPNFEGRFHGQLVTEWSDEKRRAAIEKMKHTFKVRGTVSGANNPRWAGGLQKHDCVICGKESEYRPYIHRKILAKEQSPTCSQQCAIALGRRSIVQERTSIEIKMAEELEAREIEYIEQYNLGDKFRLDFLLPKYSIVIECDGDYWHTLPDVVKRDKSKNAYIKACGYSLYRFWEREINLDIKACVDKVFAEINAKEAIIKWQYGVN